MKHLLVIGDPLQAHSDVFEVIQCSFLDRSQITDNTAAIVLNSRDVELVDESLKSLRQHPETALMLVYNQRPTRLGEALGDGKLPDDLPDEIAQYERHLQWLHADVLEKSRYQLENRMIAYLWLNRHRRIRPIRVLATRGMYQYPLIDLWDDYPAKEFWLASASRTELIKTEKLIDRVRACQRCNSGMLNYIDTCPSCHSIDIQTEAAIHCFTCGHIATQGAFMRQDNLVCPNCLTTLRHIGTDYDRPLEDQRCNTCNTLFTDAYVKVHCLYCNFENDIESLKTHRYYSYCLGNLGITQAKTGSDRHMLPAVMGDALSREHFVWMARWVDNLTPRHQKRHMVMALHLKNLDDLSLKRSEIELLNHVEEFGRRLRGELRKTDVFCRYSTSVLFFLLTDADDKAIDNIKARMESIGKEQIDNPLEIHVLLKVFPDTGTVLDFNAWFRHIFEELMDD
ncbi:Uncharacterised protein [BD1-7 clade bacterium]|uniref:Thaumarchaeal output domain-containing protein n=1 Tax=BD1-7 clade bacterium TaxID=2029982 RepID=A0A5S9Q6L1_9GAMM|nr:Uncharacterised protein [BD1-7 clade bacterium]CAA0113147.1 Uncharacterised protein [BD1-7 clade bacterium]